MDLPLIRVIKDFRVESASRFMASRGLSMKNAFELLGVDQKTYSPLLLTSSCVHGIATTKSDVDFIGVDSDSSQSGLRMATQKYIGDNHLECIRFSATELKHSLDALDAIKSLSGSEIRAFHATWSAHCALSVKYLERVVNGVCTNEEAPYFEGYIEALSKFKVCEYWGEVFSSGMYLCLAAIAGEGPLARGYLDYHFTALLQLRLAASGVIISSRKWASTLWENWESAVRHEHPMPEIDEYLVSLKELSPLPLNQAPSEIIQDIIRVGTYFGETVSMQTPLLSKSLENAAEYEILPGMLYVKHNNVGTLIPDSIRPFSALVLGDVAGLTPSECRSLIRLGMHGLASVKASGS